MRKSCRPPFAVGARHGGVLLKIFGCLLLLPAALIQQAAAQQTPPAVAASAAETTAREGFGREAKVTVPDVWVTDQDGRKVRFYTDLVKGRKIAVGFFYTTCTFICTRHGEFFSKLQAALGERLGEEVFLISVTMDPLNDTPAKLNRWARTYHRKAGWTLVTGPVDNLSQVLKVFTGNTAGPRDDHSSFFYISDERTGSWQLVDTLAPPAAVADKLGRLHLKD
jgi:protein SCO1/2